MQITQAEPLEYYYDFDETDIETLLANSFTESTEDDSYTYANDDGMYETGALNTQAKTNIWTTKRAFSLPEEGDNYGVGMFVRNYSNNGMASMGFTTESTNSVAGGSYPIPATGVGVAFHGGGGSFVNNTNVSDMFNYGGEDLEDRWYWVELDIQAMEGNLYDLHFEIYETDQYDEDSNLKSDNSTFSMSNVTFNGADEIYAYFGTSDSRFDRIDDLSIDATPLPRALPPVPTAIRSFTNDSTGDVFLGGDFIEVGINRLGSFGTDRDASTPANFFGTSVRDNIGMSTNPTGFGVNPDLRMDYFMPGSEEERWAIGYREGGNQVDASNAALSGSEDIDNNTVVDQSSGNTLRASSVGTYDNSLETTQVISFEREQKFFRNEVTLKNVGDSTKESVRYMRSFDPDNTVDQDGDYETRNYIPYTHEAGDGKAVVVADTSNNDSDPVFQANGSRSPILFFSSDSRARVSTFGFSNDDPYEEEAYDGALPKGTSVDEDQAITIAFDVGSLAPGQSQTVVYYTSLDNRDVEDIINEIEDVSSNFGNDKNGDGILDSAQPHVTSVASTLTGKIVVLEVDEGCSIDSALTKGESDNRAQDAGYDYPNGLLDFIVNCGDPGYTTNVKQYYYDVLPEGFVPRKYNPSASSYFDIPEASIELKTVYGYNSTVLSYRVTDGGDLDVDGELNGIIVDPAGLGIRGVGVPNTGLGGANFSLGQLTINR